MFLAAANAGASDTQGRGPYDDFWYGPIPGKSSAGVRVNDETAMRLAIFFACVGVISQDIGKVPLHMFRRKDNGERERVTDHPVIKLLAKPARQLTGVEWRERLQAHQLLRGNAYAEIRTNFRGRIVELRPWKPTNVRVELLANDAVRYQVRDKNGIERPYVEGEVLHLRGLSVEDGPNGLSPVDQMREMLGEATAAQRYGSSFFANDARPGLWLEHPGSFKDGGQRDDWIVRFKRMFGGGNRFNPLLMEYGIKIHELGQVNHTDLQFIELRKMKNNEICSMFRVPPHKVGILERSTNNNIEHQGIEYVTDCMLTWCRRWEERLAADLLSDSEREEYYFEFMLDGLMRGDAKSRYEAYKQGIDSGFLTRNEVRRRENLDPLKGLDEPLQPLNMVPAGTPPTKPGGAEAPVPDDSPTDDAQQARARSLEVQARRRVLNREVRALTKEWERAAGAVPAFMEGASTFYAGHLAFVEEALAVARADAEAYCLTQCKEIEIALEGEHLPQLLDQWARRAAAMSLEAQISRKTVTTPGAKAPADSPQINVMPAVAYTVEKTVVEWDANGIPKRVIERRIDETRTP